MDKPKLVNFAQKKAYLIEDKYFKKYIVDKFARYKLNIDKNNKFYKFLTESDFDILKKYEHLVSFNLNQRPVYLFLTKYQNQKYCLYVNSRTQEIHSVKHRFSETLYEKDTILEGELVKVSQKNWIFLISDLLVFNGYPNYEALNQKIQKMHKIINDDYTQDIGLDHCQFIIKDYIEYPYLASFVNEYLLTIPYQNYVSGLIFRPIVKSNKHIILVLNKPQFHDFARNQNNNGNSSNANSSNANSSNANSSNANSSNANSSNANSSNANSNKSNYSNKVNSNYVNSLKENSMHKVQSTMDQFRIIPTSNKETEGLDPGNQLNSNKETTTSNTLYTQTFQDKIQKKSKINNKIHKKVSFKIKSTDKPDVYQLWLDGEDKHYGIAAVPNIETSQFIKSLFDSNQESVVVECHYMKNFNKWKPVKVNSNGTVDKLRDLV